MPRRSLPMLFVLLCAVLLCAFAAEAQTVFSDIDTNGASRVYIADLDLDGSPEMLCLQNGALSCFSADGAAYSVQPLSVSIRSLSLSLTLRKGSGYAWRIEAELEDGTMLARLVCSSLTLRFTDVFLDTTQKGCTVSGKKVSPKQYKSKDAAYRKKWIYQGITAPNSERYSDALLAAWNAISYKPISPTKITAVRSKVTVSMGETTQLSYTLTPTYATVKTVTFSSDNESIAKVDANGVVTPIGYGKVVIRGTTANGKTTKWSITVPRPKPTGVSITSDDPDNSVVAKFTLQLYATILPEGAISKVSWSSSAKSIATVSSKGVVKGVRSGTCVITAKASNGAKGTIVIRVIKPISVTNVLLDTQYLEMHTGSTYSLHATVYPENATYPAVTWSSSDKSIVTVDANGTVTAKKSGEAIITATTRNGTSSSCTINVISSENISRRALVLANGNNAYVTSEVDDLLQKANEAEQIVSLLEKMAFQGKSIAVSKLVNPSRAADALRKIENTFKDAEEDDINILYIVCHGTNPSLGTYELELGQYGSVSGQELRNVLDGLNGHFFLFIESCYSGDLIGKGTSPIDSFLKDFSGSEGLSSKTGEFSTSKYSVLCSACSTETSCFYWTDAEHNISYFGYALSLAGGWDPEPLEGAAHAIPPDADLDSDGSVTMSELTVYVKSMVRVLSNGSQNVASYTPNPQAVVFRREDRCDLNESYY